MDELGRSYRQGGQDMQNVMEAGPCLRSMQIDYDDEVNNRAVQWLYDRARDGSSSPFMLTVSFTSPHDPYVARPEFWDNYTDDEIDLPGVPPLSAAERDAHSERLHQHYSIGEVEISEATIRRARHGYYASIDYVDSKLAELRRVLEETGLADNTILVFTSDHGDMMGERGLYYKKCFFEWAMRVPMIFWAPGPRVMSPIRCRFSTCCRPSAISPASAMKFWKPTAPR